MKYNILLVGLLSACTQSRQKPVPQIDEVIICDRTDPHKLVPDARAHVSALHLPENKEREIIVRYLEIVDRKTTPVTVLHLPSITATDAANRNGAPMYRESLTMRFLDTVRKTLQSGHRGSDTGFLKHSEIFATVAGQLTALAKRTAVQKRLYLYSDLQEHSTLFNCYTKSSQQLLSEHPDRVASLLASRHLLPASLQGITTYFLYEPQSREDDLTYTRMLQVYRRLLEPLGAIVVQQAQNKSFDHHE